MRRSFDGDHYRAIRGNGVAFESNCAGIRGLHLQDVVLPPRLALGVFAGHESWRCSRCRSCPCKSRSRWRPHKRNCETLSVPVCRTGGPPNSLLAGISVQVPFRAVRPRAKAENPTRSVVKRAPANVVVEHVLIKFLVAPAISAHARYRTGKTATRADLRILASKDCTRCG